VYRNICIYFWIYSSQLGKFHFWTAFGICKMHFKGVITTVFVLYVSFSALPALPCRSAKQSKPFVQDIMNTLKMLKNIKRQDVKIILSTNHSHVKIKGWTEKHIFECFGRILYLRIENKILFRKGMCRALVKAVRKIRVPQNGKNFLISWESIRFPRRTLIQGVGWLIS